MTNRITTLVLVCTVLLTAGATGALAQGSSGTDTGTDVVRIGSQDVTIDDATVRIADVHVSGSGLPDRHVDHATFTVQESTVTLDGATVTVDGTTYRIGEVTVTIRDVGVTLQDVSVGN